MRFRKLRIAWSVFWGLACLLLIVLWVRSYWWQEQFVRINSRSGRFLTLGQCSGAVFLRTGDPTPRDLRANPISDKWYAHRTEADPYRVQKFWIKLEIPN